VLVEGVDPGKEKRMLVPVFFPWYGAPGGTVPNYRRINNGQGLTEYYIAAILLV